MRKYLVFIFVFVPVFAFSQVAVNLDTALSNITNHFNERLPANSRVLVLNFTSNFPALSEYVVNELIGYLVNTRRLIVVDRQSLETIRQELNFQMSGFVSDETALSIGRMLGAQVIISGGLTPLGNIHRLRINAIGVDTAQILGMQNVDVMQDSRLTALMGTGQPGTSTAAANYVVLPNAGWVIGSDPLTYVTSSVTYENIGGSERDVINLEITFARGNYGKWGQLSTYNELNLQMLRRGSGVRFKVLGDGTTWVFRLVTTETLADSNHYQASIQTRRNRVVNIDIPFSRLRHPGYGRSVPFIKDNIEWLIFERGSTTESGASTIKIFDFEIY